MVNTLNIAFIGNQIAFGGGATSFYLLVKSLKDKPVNKFVFASQIKSEVMKQKFLKYTDVVERINISEVKSSQTSKTSLINYFRALQKVKSDAEQIIRIIDKYNIDIIHFNNSVFSHLYSQIKEQRAVKIITHVREMILSNRGFLPGVIIQNIYKYSYSIITISDNEKAAFRDDKSIYVLPNPFDFSVLNKSYKNLRKEWCVDDDVILVGMMGRYAKSKGHLLFLQTLNKVKKENKIRKTKFVIVGVAGEKPKWKRIIKLLLFKKDFGDIVKEYITTNKLENDIHLIPYTQDVFSVINTLDIIVRPSLYKDPWGRDIIESMAMSKPIIATGKSEFYIENNINGFLVDAFPNNIAAKLEYLVNKPKERKRMGIRNLNKIRSMCDIERYGNSVLSCYLNL